MSFVLAQGLLGPMTFMDMSNAPAIMHDLPEEGRQALEVIAER